MPREHWCCDTLAAEANRFADRMQSAGRTRGVWGRSVVTLGDADAG